MSIDQHARSKRYYAFKDKIFVVELLKAEVNKAHNVIFLPLTILTSTHGAGLLGVRAAGGGPLLHLLDCRHVSDQVSAGSGTLDPLQSLY